MQNNLPLIKTPRQDRFIQALVDAGDEGIGVRELEPIVGANHIPAEKRDLVAQGWPIERIIFPAQDRDGRTCYPSKYRLNAEWREKARIATKRREEEGLQPLPQGFIKSIDESKN